VRYWCTYLLCCAQRTSVHPSHHSRLTPHSLTLSRAVPERAADGVLCFEYAMYAQGSRLPVPLDLWETPSCSATSSTCTSTGTSHFGVNTIPMADQPSYMHLTPTAGRKRTASLQRVVEEAASASVQVLVVGGGGAVGIREWFLLLFSACIASCTNIHKTQNSPPMSQPCIPPSASRSCTCDDDAYTCMSPSLPNPPRAERARRAGERVG
jgi:hypothetical protein